MQRMLSHPHPVSHPMCCVAPTTSASAANVFPPHATPHSMYYCVAPTMCAGAHAITPRLIPHHVCGVYSPHHMCQCNGCYYTPPHVSRNTNHVSTWMDVTTPSHRMLRSSNHVCKCISRLSSAQHNPPTPCSPQQQPCLQRQWNLSNLWLPTPSVAQLELCAQL